MRERLASLGRGLPPVSFKQWIADRWRPLSFGERGEVVAARCLRRQGYRIVVTRRRMRYGEIDISAVDGRTVVFVEVKTRRSASAVRPAIAVDSLRRQRMPRAANAFLKSHGLLQCCAGRLDIVEVVWPVDASRPTITHHVNAFPAEGTGQFFR
ncbi:YraN family protein [Lacipirellula limnantheis]|uniref:YraN family protein n=1 Tax=Lacipirellula limnantheis TaxID=2528024 RepID=UPI00119FFC51|nr:YraN family protein [Lacipirellula limnantheis]